MKRTGLRTPIRLSKKTKKVRAAIAWVQTYWPGRSKRVLELPSAQVYSRLNRAGVFWYPPARGEKAPGEWKRLKRAKSPIGIRITAASVEDCEQVLESLSLGGHCYKVTTGPKEMRGGEVAVYADLGRAKR